MEFETGSLVGAAKKLGSVFIAEFKGHHYTRRRTHGLGMRPHKTSTVKKRSSNAATNNMTNSEAHKIINSEGTDRIINSKASKKIINQQSIHGLLH
jgi:hypothetical protein